MAFGGMFTERFLQYFAIEFQCVLHEPCDSLVQCVNMAPGFRCEPCPTGFDGTHANGYYAQSVTNEYQNQLCEDIDECAMGIADCGINADCVNTVGSYVCNCNRGYHQNVTYGCQPAVGMCPDGTFCDKNAVCKHAEGLKVHVCSSPSPFNSFTTEMFFVFATH